MFRSFSTIFVILTYGLIFMANVSAMPLCEQNNPEGIANCPRVIPREEWGAKPPTCTDMIKQPVKYVVIHHTHLPAACHDLPTCIAAMRSMQRFHQDDRKWCDIGYNFAVGGDGLVFVGRGWGVVGAHAPPYNMDSVGITIIGDWTKSLPNQDTLDAVKALIKCGVNSGFIDKDYKLIGHRQARTVTECPGEALFHEIQKWPHWSDDWINADAATKPQIKLLETNTADQRRSSEEKEDNYYRIDNLRRRRYLA